MYLYVVTVLKCSMPLCVAAFVENKHAIIFFMLQKVASFSTLREKLGPDNIYEA